MSAAETVLLRILDALNSPGRGKDILFCSEKSGFSLDTLDRGDTARFIKAMRKTNLKVVAVPLSLSCEGDIPKKLRKFLGVQEACSIGFIKQGKYRTVTFISATLFQKRWGKNDSHGENVIVIR